MPHEIGARVPCMLYALCTDAALMMFKTSTKWGWDSAVKANP